MSDGAASDTKPVRAGEELDLEKLGAFLGGPVTVEQFPGGHSNLTYLVRQGDREMVLRRPPFGSKVKSAHDMGREYTVLSKLSLVYDRAPKVFAYEPTGDVLGAPFYLMERRKGVIIRKQLPAGADARRLCELLVDSFVDLHAVDYVAAGLGDFGKPQGYVERQGTGWSERYTKSQTDDIPAVTEVAAWLAKSMPADGAPSLVHNDYKLDNVIYDASLSKITGVLDWEMATIGDPLMDLGTSLAYWVEASDPQPLQMFAFCCTAAPGMMTRQEVATRYLERSGRRTDHLLFYYIFGLLKTMVIGQQIYYRFAKGLTQDPRFGALIHAVRLIAEQARLAIDKNAL